MQSLGSGRFGRLPPSTSVMMEYPLRWLNGCRPVESWGEECLGLFIRAVKWAAYHKAETSKCVDVTRRRRTKHLAQRIESFRGRPLQGAPEVLCSAHAAGGDFAHYDQTKIR